jgi:hypothetical protein
MPNSEQIETLKTHIREYLDDGVISEKEEFAILFFGLESGFEEKEIADLIGQVENEMGLDGQNSGLMHLKMLAKKFLSNDGVIDDNELFILQATARKLGMNESQVGEIVAHINKRHGMVSKPDVVKTESERESPNSDQIGPIPNAKPFSPTIQKALISVAVILLGIGLFCQFSNKLNLNADDAKNKHAQPSKLIYRTIIFDKYVVAGNSYMEKNGKFSKGFIRYIKGEADVSFDLSKFKVEPDGSLSYIGEKIEGTEGSSSAVLPYTIDVRVKEENKYEVYEIQPTPITNEEAKAIGTAVGAIAAVGGGYIGMQAGGILGKTIAVFQPQLKFAGGAGALAGGVLGAGAGAYGGYALCGNYLTGVQLSSDITEQEKQNITKTAEQLIAAELLFDPDLQQEFTKAFLKYMKELYRGQQPDIHLTEGKFINIKTQ